MQSKDSKALIYFENNGVHIKMLEDMKILTWVQPSPLLPFVVKFSCYHSPNKLRRQHLV